MMITGPGSCSGLPSYLRAPLSCRWFRGYLKKLASRKFLKIAGVRGVEDTRRPQPTEATKQGSERLTETEARNTERTGIRARSSAYALCLWSLVFLCDSPQRKQGLSLTPFACAWDLLILLDCQVQLWLEGLRASFYILFGILGGGISLGGLLFSPPPTEGNRSWSAGERKLGKEGIGVGGEPEVRV